MPTLATFFNEYFGVTTDDVDNYGAFNVSLINDLPLFIDPFLLFNSGKPEYQQLHKDILRYMIFLRDKATSGEISPDLIKSWFMFPEVKQNWLGFSLHGNGGSGLEKTLRKPNRKTSASFLQTSARKRSQKAVTSKGVFDPQWCRP